MNAKILNKVIKRFYETFRFQLASNRIYTLSSRSQFVTLNKSNNLRCYNIKYLPYVLTELWIKMLFKLLKRNIDKSH